MRSHHGVSVFDVLVILNLPEFRSPSHAGGLNRSASLSCTERAPEAPGSVCGSNTQLPGTPFQYTPDFCVRALTDLQFVKVPPGAPVARVMEVIVGCAVGVDGV